MSIEGNIRWRQITGWPSSLIGIRHRVGALTREKSFKIGITNDPRRRARQYDRNEPFYDEMIVLYKSPSIDNARTLEKKLINAYIDNDRKPSDNRNRGGQGRIGAPPHYAYVVVERG